MNAKKFKNGINYLGPNLKWHRRFQGLTQSDLERLTGVAQETISAIENGTNINPLLKTISKLAIALDIKIDFLLVKPQAGGIRRCKPQNRP